MRRRRTEGLYVERMLRALCDGIDEPVRKSGRGRPPIPLKDATFAAIMKVYSAKSQRRAQSDLADSADKGNLARVAHFNTISNYLSDESTTALLIWLIEESAKPTPLLRMGSLQSTRPGFDRHI